MRDYNDRDNYNNVMNFLRGLQSQYFLFEYNYVLITACMLCGICILITIIFLLINLI